MYGTLLLYRCYQKSKKMFFFSIKEYFFFDVITNKKKLIKNIYEIAAVI